MTIMITHDAFVSIDGVYKVYKAATDSYWLYKKNVGPNGNLCSSYRVVFFGTSREEVNNWIQSRNEERSFVLSEN